MDYKDLSNDSKETINSMVAYCIERGYFMGMSEGYRKDGSKDSTRTELESFILNSIKTGLKK